MLGVIRIADEFLPYRTGAVENSMLALILSRAQKDLNWQPVNDRETIIEMRIREPTRLCLNNWPRSISHYDLKNEQVIWEIDVKSTD